MGAHFDRFKSFLKHWSRGLSRAEILMWMAYEMHADDFGVSYPGDTVVASIMGCRVKNLHRVRSSLCVKGLLKIVGGEPGKSLHVQTLSPRKAPVQLSLFSDSSTPPSNRGRTARSTPLKSGTNPPQIRESLNKDEQLKKQQARASAFGSFWERWPDHERKTDERRCRAMWERLGLNAMAAEIVASLEAWKGSETWARDGGRWVPAPLSWLDKGAWAARPTINGSAAVAPPEQRLAEVIQQASIVRQKETSMQEARDTSEATVEAVVAGLGDAEFNQIADEVLARDGMGGLRLLAKRKGRRECRALKILVAEKVAGIAARAESVAP